MSSSTFSRSDSTVAAVAVSAAAALIYYALTPFVRSSPNPRCSVKTDQEWFAQAHQLRLALDKPLQSRFRVVALFLLEDGISFIPGTNDEPAPSISGAICAERCALLQWRLLYRGLATSSSSMVQRIYIVTDAHVPIPPGMLCREYMYGHPAIDAKTTPILLQSADPQSPIQRVTLQGIYPHAPIYMGLPIEAQEALGSKLGITIENTMVLGSCMIPGMNTQQIQTLWKTAHQAAQQERRRDVHSISYGCAIAVKHHNDNNSHDDDSTSTIRYLSAAQAKALEYGASIDAVCQILPQLQALPSTNSSNNNNNHDTSVILALIQVDQWGIPHAPYAAARSLLVEHGWGHVPCIVSRLAKSNHLSKEETLEVYTVPTRELAPMVPDFTKPEADS